MTWAWPPNAMTLVSGWWCVYCDRLREFTNCVLVKDNVPFCHAIHYVYMSALELVDLPLWFVSEWACIALDLHTEFFYLELPHLFHSVFPPLWWSISPLPSRPSLVHPQVSPWSWQTWRTVVCLCDIRAFDCRSVRGLRPQLHRLSPTRAVTSHDWWWEK
jgi:hypothetical protein